MALWWLLRAGVARVGLVGVPFPCGAGRTLGGFGAFAYKKPLLRPGGALEPLLWPCGGFCLRAWRVLTLLRSWANFWGVGKFGGFEAWQTAALNAYKEAIAAAVGLLSSHCCGLVVAFACSIGRGKGSRKTGSTQRTFGAFGGFEAWQTAALNAYKKPLLRPWVPLSHCCGLVVAFACERRACWEAERTFGGFGGLRPGKRQL